MDPFASFAQLTDPRVQGRCLHQLVDILALLLCGTLAGCDDLPEICDYGRARLAFLRTEPGLAFANGIPSEDTLERLLKRLDPNELAQTLRSCAGSLAERQLCVSCASVVRRRQGTPRHHPRRPAPCPGPHGQRVGGRRPAQLWASANWC